MNFLFNISFNCYLRSLFLFFYIMKKNYSNIVNDDISSETISSRTISDNDDVPVPDLDKYESSFINDDPIDLPPNFLQEIDQYPDSPVINNTNLPDECFFQAFPSNPPVQSVQ